MSMDEPCPACEKTIEFEMDGPDVIYEFCPHCEVELDVCIEYEPYISSVDVAA